MFVTEHQIKQKRQAWGMKQSELATRVGTTQSEISRIENGEREPGVYMALRIARVLGTAVDELFREGR